MSPIETLARDICWAGFTTKQAKTGKTKASYWRAIAETAREGYRNDARWFFWTLKKLGHDRTAKLLALHDHIRRREP